jgi:hypothetical protein
MYKKNVIHVPLNRLYCFLHLLVGFILLIQSPFFQALVCRTCDSQRLVFFVQQKFSSLDLFVAELKNSTARKSELQDGFHSLDFAEETGN